MSTHVNRIILALAFLFVATAAHAQTVPIYPQGSNAAEGSHLFKGTVLHTISVTWNAATTARYLMIFDGVALPSNGSTTNCQTTQATGCLAYCAYAPNSTTAPNLQTWDWGIHPLKTQNGVVAAMSTGAGCGTLTVDTTSNFFYAMVQF